MPDYQLEIKQLVSYPRCRIYREFLQTLIADRGIRTSGCPGLFCFSVLCSYANFRTSYLRIDGLTYTIYPGEWICRVGKLAAALRLRSRRRTLEVLDTLQNRHLIQYSLLGRGNLVKYKVINWHRHNTVLDYNCPCQKETGFFFLPVSTAGELVGAEKCSEMDILLDLWISAVYRDDQVQGSFDGPVAYLRNGTGCPLVSYSELAQRWGLSKATVGRVLRKLERAGHIAPLTFPGRHGTAIYLQNYLSTMFQISDAKLLYGLLLDRMGLSAKNGWYDELGRVYIYYTLDEIQEDMNCGHDKATKLLVELDNGKRGFGLIERVRQGHHKPRPPPVPLPRKRFKRRWPSSKSNIHPAHCMERPTSPAQAGRIASAKPIAQVGP